MNAPMRVAIAAPQRRYDLVEQALREAGLEVARMRAPEEVTAERLAVLRPRYVFFLHWSWRIPTEVHAHHECVVFHMSDVPYGRGGSPLQNLIVRGHNETRLSALRCVDDLDAGPVYLKRPLSLLGTAEEILARAALLMTEMILEIVARQPQPEPQSGEVVAFRRRRPEEGDIAPLRELAQAHDWIRMLDAEGYPPAFLETEHFRLEFSRASLRPDAVLADVRIVKKP